MLWLATTSAALLLGLPFPGGNGSWPSAAGGGCVGLALFVGLARRRPHVSFVRRTAVRSGHVALRAFHEEAVWRGALLALATVAFDRVPAAIVVTAGFAAVHAPAQGWRAAVHLITGGSFSALALGPGLPAAMSAHAVYNALIAATLTIRPLPQDCPFRTVPALAPPPYAGRTTRETVPAPESGGEATPILRLEDVARRFGAVVALDGVSLELRPGEIVTLLGPNGAGKSTAFAIALGLRRPERGRARLFGLDPQLVGARRQIGVSPQETSFPPMARVRELIELVRAHFPEPAATADLLAAFGLDGLADRLAGGLSGGERRRLALALAFAGRPRALFLDEPTVGLDVEARRKAWASIRAFRDSGGAVLLTTHHLDEAEELATRIVVLDRGRIRTKGTAREIRARSGTARVALELAELPELPAEVRVERVGDRYVLHTADPDHVVALIVASGIAFSGLEVTHVSLEQAVLHVTAADP
ncbi:MAG TPA: ATP-binding cassette domain-containing protein [Gaiellaceae bacterium]|nr:ATP-binding cassette domain-containing protein [Gaiellaceae bacterium]